jgi:2'-hydroxyisoflavone reductase
MELFAIIDGYAFTIQRSSSDWASIRSQPIYKDDINHEQDSTFNAAAEEVCSMKILVLGGTKFVGRHIVRTAIDRNHNVTLFNRGQTNPNLFPEVEKLIGDRDGDLAPLRERTWNAVIDTCGYVPRIVRKSAHTLSDFIDHYTFISTISVFASFEKEGLSEDDPVGTLDDDTVEEITSDTYGPLKALCEAAVLDEMADKALIIRPGLIVGPHDPTDRFTYWVRRCAQGGDILAPNPPEQNVQFIDARDLASWTLDMIEAGQSGLFNSDGPENPLTLGELLQSCCSFSERKSRLVWVDGLFLLDAGITPWSQVPLWLPGPENAGAMAVDCTRAINTGLRFRPLMTTISDTLNWDRGRDHSVPMKAGLEPSREAELLELTRT